MGEVNGDVAKHAERAGGEQPVIPGDRSQATALAGFLDVPLVEAKAQEREREADAVGASGELLGEQHQADRPEQIQRPGDRPRDEERGQRSLSAARGSPG